VCLFLLLFDWIENILINKFGKQKRVNIPSCGFKPWFGIAFITEAGQILNLFCLKLISFMFSNHFDVLISKKNFKKNIILMYFRAKNILKSSRYYTPKHLLKYLDLHLSLDFWSFILVIVYDFYLFINTHSYRFI
jgi:hypothetical protein